MFSFLNKVKQVTFVTKSTDRGEGKHLPKDHPRLIDMEKERQEHKKNGDIFAQEFTQATSGSGIKIEHLPVDEFLKWSPSKIDFEGHMVCTMGGDGTFIQTAQAIGSRDVLTLGINPEPGNSLGYLCGYQFNDKKEIARGARKLLHRFQNNKISTLVRPRVQVLNLTRPDEIYPLCN